MNDLDRKIAELKGLKIDTLFGDSSGPIGMDIEIAPGSGAFERSPCWSTSDTKALELVDELTQDAPDRLGKFRFVLFQGYDFPNLIPANQWWAAFYYSESFDHPRETAGEADAPTRPEAICRAYIAAMEWMKGKKG